MAFIQVARFLDVREAQIARSALEASRIPVILADEFRAQTLWTEQLTIGGVRLFVPEGLAEDTREFLQAVRTNGASLTATATAPAPMRWREAPIIALLIVASWLFSWPILAFNRPSVWRKLTALTWIILLVVVGCAWFFR